jgi:hypothetical protein
MEMNGLVFEEKELSDDEDAPKTIREERGRREPQKGLRRERELDEQETPRRTRERDDEGARKGRERFNANNVERFKKKPEEPAAEEAEAAAEADGEEPKEERPKRGRAKPVAEDDKKPARTLRGKKDRNTKTLSPEQEAFRDMLLDMSSTHNAKLLADGNAVIKEVAVKNLVNTLKEDSDNVSVIVFDGVISQRILDVSVEKGIKTIVGTRKGNITKMPAGISIFTKEDLY